MHIHHSIRGHRSIPTHVHRANLLLPPAIMLLLAPVIALAGTKVHVSHIPQGDPENFHSITTSKATERGYKVRFTTTADLVLQLEKARREHRFEQYLRRAILGPSLMILDKIGYLPLKKEQADLTFQNQDAFRGKPHLKKERCLIRHGDLRVFQIHVSEVTSAIGKVRYYGKQWCDSPLLCNGLEVNRLYQKQRVSGPFHSTKWDSSGSKGFEYSLAYEPLTGEISDAGVILVAMLIRP